MSNRLGQRESEIMAVLWELGEASAEDVRKALPVELHDSTVRTLLKGLEAKGFISHSVRERRFIYESLVPREEVQGHAVRTLLQRFFDNSGKALLLRLVEEHQVSPEELKRIAQQQAAKKRQRRKRR